MDFGFIFILLFSILVECRPQGYFQYPHENSQESLSDIIDYYKTGSEHKRCPENGICDFLNRERCTHGIECGDCLHTFYEDVDGFCTKIKGQPDPVVTDRDIDSLGEIERQIDNIGQSDVKEKDAGNKVTDVPAQDATTKGEPEVTSKVVAPHPPAPQKHTQEDKQPVSVIHDHMNKAAYGDIWFLAIIAACSVAGLIGLIFAGVCWYRLQKNVKAASECEYPAYGVTGPNKERVVSPDDRKLAQSAQMYHYQRQKQQMIALERANGEMKHDGSEEESDVENEEGDYTVYECPGLAPTGEMEVKNPLFNEDVPPSPPQDGSGPQ